MFYKVRANLATQGAERSGADGLDAVIAAPVTEWRR
jgi:hypothetical protein